MSQKRESPRALAEAEKSAVAVEGQPQDVYALLHRYGTYNIQPTADSENVFPQIAQGLPAESKNKKAEPRSVE